MSSNWIYRVTNYMLLKGATQALKNTKIVYTEVEFVPFYKNQPLFEDVEKFMSENNFRLHKLYDIRKKEGVKTFGDAVFINDKFLKN